MRISPVRAGRQAPVRVLLPSDRRVVAIIPCAVILLSLPASARRGFMPFHETKSVEEWMGDLQAAGTQGSLQAVVCLGHYGERAVKAVPLLREKLVSQDGFVRRCSLAAVVGIYESELEHAIPRKDERHWIERLRTGREPIQAAYALESLATDASLGALTAALGHEDPVVRYFAARAIREVIQAAAYGKDHLSARDKKLEVTAIRKRQTAVCMAALIGLSESENFLLADAAVDALGAFGGHDNDAAAPAVPAVAAALSRGDRRLQFAATRALSWIGRPASDAVPALIEALRGPGAASHPRFDGLSAGGPRRMVVQALGSIGPGARAAIPEVTKALRDEDAGVRAAAASAIDQIGGVADAIEELKRNLTHPDPKVRSRSAYALSKAGDRGREVVADLTEALADPSRKVRFSAGCAIRDLARFARGSVPALEKCLQDEDRFVRSIAREALDKIRASVELHSNDRTEDAGSASPLVTAADRSDIGTTGEPEESGRIDEADAGHKKGEDLGQHDVDSGRDSESHGVSWLWLVLGCLAGMALLGLVAWFLLLRKLAWSMRRSIRPNMHVRGEAMYRHSKTVGIAVGVCALAALAAILLFLRPRADSGQPTVRLAGEHADVQTAPEAEPAPPVREGASLSPASDRPAEEPREAAGDTDKEELPYEIRVRDTYTSHETGSDATMKAFCSCDIDFGRELPERMALVDSAHLLRGETEGGAPVVPRPSHDFIGTLKSGSRRLRFSVMGIVPADTESIRFLEGTITKVVAAGTDRVVWDDPANQMGEVRSAAGFEFVLASYNRAASEAKIEVHFRVPPPGPLDPLYWASRSITLGARCEDGSLVESRGAGSGTGLGGRWGHLDCGLKVGGRKVRALEVSFVTSIRMEELPFRLEDVKLPSAPKAAAGGKDREIGPRGKTTVASEGYVFRMHRAELSRRRRGGRQTGYLRLDLKVGLPQEQADGHSVVASSSTALDAAAVDDRGTRLTARKWSGAMSRVSWGGPEKHLSTRFPLPHDEADRLVTFSGKYRVFCAKSISSASFALAELSEDIKAPIKRGPVALTEMSHVNDLMKFTMRIDKAHFPTETYSWVRSMEFDILDDAGKPMGRWSGGGDAGGRGSRTHRQSVSFETGDRVPATFRVLYPVGCSIKDIPFEFEDVGLPRKPGKYSYEEEVF